MIDENRLTELLRDRSPDARRELSRILHWMNQFDLRLCRIESGLKDLASRASNQEETLSMLCTVLKELDDPYGFGRSLDERVHDDAENGYADDSNE